MFTIMSLCNHVLHLLCLLEKDALNLNGIFLFVLGGLNKKKMPN